MKIFTNEKNLMRKIFLSFSLFLGVTACFSQKLINVPKEISIKTENSSFLKKSFIGKSSKTEGKSISRIRKITSDKVGDIALKYGDEIVSGIGNGKAGTMLPLSMFHVDPYLGSSLTEVNIGLYNDATNIKLHLRSSIDGSDLYTQDIGDLKAGWHNIKLTTPYKISTSTIVIGYEATTAASGNDAYILGVTDNTTFLDNARYLEMGGKFYPQSYGCWAIQGIVEGNNLPQNEIALYSLSTKLVKSNSPFIVKGTFWNLGAKPVVSYELGYSVNGVNGSQTVKCDSVKPYELGNFELNIQAANIPHQDSALINLDVKKVNEADDEYSDDNSGSAYLNSTDISYPHKVVVEEATGAWCGWCVRGIVGLGNMRKKYPDTFIPIAIHYGDKKNGENKDGLEIDPAVDYSYYEFLSKNITGFPTCIVDRKYSNDPYYGLEDIYNEEQEELCLFDYKYKSLNYNSATGTVSATVTAKSAFDYKSTNYTTAFVVVEDNLTTTNAQSNYYANNANGEMGGFENLPSSITGQNYDDVALGIYSNWQGDSSLPATIASGTSYDYSYSFKLPTIKKASNVRIVSLLINATTGEIVNAASAPLVGNTTGINTLTNKSIDIIVNRTSDNTITITSQNAIEANVSLYTINGELISSAHMSGTQTILPAPMEKGIYFVKVAGKTTKIIL